MAGSTEVEESTKDGRRETGKHKEAERSGEEGEGGHGGPEISAV
jgi:hypothetical protein